MTCRSRAGSDCCPIDGGVREPLVGVVPWLASLEVSVDRSVLKLALDLLRKSLKLRKDGAMAHVTWTTKHRLLVSLWYFEKSHDGAQEERRGWGAVEFGGDVASLELPHALGIR